MTDWALIGELALARGPRTCRGACLSACHDLHYEWLRIAHADPRVLVSRKLLQEMLTCGTGPHADLRPGPDCGDIPRQPRPSGLRGAEKISYEMEGWLLTVRGENRTVVYRLIERVPWDSYVAEWPD